MPTARLSANRSVSPTSSLLEFDRSLDGYTAAGQYVSVTVEGHKPGYFALANSPGEAVRLLVKSDGETSKALVALEPGSVVEMSQALGKGFPLDRAAGRELVLLCAGSGISACRPVLASEVAAGLPRTVHMYYGVRNLEDRCFLDDLSSWEEAGVKLHTVISGGEAEWSGHRGYAQHAAARDGLFRDGTAIVVVGKSEMIEEVRSMCKKAGLDPELILTNF